MEISAALTAITSGIQLGRTLADTATEYDKAGLKLEIATLVDQLLGAKQALTEASDKISALQSKVDEMNDISATINELAKHQDFLYRVEDGNRVAQPYCPRCLEAEKKLISLHYDRERPDWDRTCPECHNTFLVDKAARDRQNAEDSAAIARATDRGTYI